MKPSLKLEVRNIPSSEKIALSPVMTSRIINRNSMLNNFTVHTPRQLPRLSQDVKTIMKTE